MIEFGDIKLKPTRLNGKKNFKGAKIYPRELDRQAFFIVDFERDLIPKWAQDEYQRKLQEAATNGLNPDLVPKPTTKYLLQIVYENKAWKLWTGDRELWDILEQYEEADGLPVYVVGEVDFSERFPKLSFVSPKKYGLTSPSDAELDRLLTQLNLKQQL